MAQRYPKEVHDFIRENVAGHTAQELADMTNAACGTNFTKATMKAYKQNHKLRSGTTRGIPKGAPTEMYPAEVAAFIHKNYVGTGYAEMAALLKENFGREYTTSQMMGYYKNHKLKIGLTGGRFQKGNVSPNKGKKGYCAPGCEKGWFQKGDKPWDHLPVGTIVTKNDGYKWKKIDDKPGAGRFNWKQLHLLIWEEANGPVPEGCFVIFKDNDRSNTDLSNLLLVSMAENAVMNRHGLRFDTPECTEAGHLIAQIKIAAQAKRKRRVQRGGKTG